MRNLSRRSLLLAAGGAAGWAASDLFHARLPVLAGAASIVPRTDDGMLNDASGLSPTPIHRHITLEQDPGDALIDALRTEMKSAAADGRAFNIGAARHSMGGQAIPRDGIAVTLDNGLVETDTSAGTYRVHAGARWSQVIHALDPQGFSPAVMQSNHDFGVAATFSVNAHGWPVPFGPMGSTVRSLRMILPRGDLVTCSRDENPELFNLAMGGYGLIGAIVDLEVEMVPNTRLRPTFDVMPAEDYAAAFRAAVDDPAVKMAYGRLNVERASFFRHALLITYREDADQSDLPAASGSGWMAHVASRVYRGQLGNEALKSFRWWNETWLGPKLGSGAVTRNSLFNEPVVTLDDRNPLRTDILHEYFVDFDRFGDFLTACRDVIPDSYQEFLNVTLRYVAADPESVLAYAPTPRIAAVMSFSQEMTARAEDDMMRLTQTLIDRITDVGGAYYLPYRPHARLDQLEAAYVRAPEFARAKRLLDPGLVLRNNLWDSYLGLI
ncbi:FAD-binding oxidoreductase [Paracoccus aurantiacus]|uniref:FAD-binding oxidoreductase n=1 Tax=Paracoccus aurantiacus TaxID=2599412 RepID=A0A5C6S059_9RHOB|nr:FAD-dependent oxidoreductase [Paracoccus aurantiacus]TXB67743.1 FAD-binding oxidoreductase [Paracoccus aurantiacus]